MDMTFEVPVARIGPSRRTPWHAPVVAVGAAILLLVGLAVARPVDSRPESAAAGAGAPSAASDPGGADDAGSPARPGVPVAATAPDHPRRLPPTLACEDLRLAPCVRIARAALAVLPDDVGEVSGATVWRSLRCGDTDDCPPHYLRGSMPLGSVILLFADDSPRAAINVVEWRHGSGIRLGPRAWVVDWLAD
jgi:hypothetical protein